jgi:hypothetical protein
MLSPLLVFVNLFAATVLVAVLALLALGRHEGTLSAIHWPRALVFACIGGAGVGVLGVLLWSAVVWASSWGGRG